MFEMARTDCTIMDAKRKCFVNYSFHNVSWPGPALNFRVLVLLRVRDRLR